MRNPSFPHLNPITFLQIILTQSVKTRVAESPAEPLSNGNYVTQIGLSAGTCFEAAYREEFDLVGSLTIEQYVDLILAIKNQIGGKFSLISSGKGCVRVVNTQCPFGESIKQAPELCAMTSSVFGGIAASNFGYAKVILGECIGRGSTSCDVSIYTDPIIAQSLVGDEYQNENGVTQYKKTSTIVNARIQEQMHRVWCTNSENRKHKNAKLSYIVAHSSETKKALDTIEIISPTMASVLITGETGVGKELIARAIHAVSTRWSNNFIAVNCGAIPENLIESVLFGHEKGAFTGAHEVHQGFFERAEGGTLFLDEVDSLPLLAQVRLLRVLQEGEFERVGGKQALMADVRIIAAGSEQLPALLDNGSFRKDLYYRLNVVHIWIPPLRERRDDILPLADHVLGKLAEKYKKGKKSLSDQVKCKFMLYDWPGNVRELENVLENGYLFANGPLIEESRLPEVNYTGQQDAKVTRLSLKQARKQAADKVEARILDDAMKLLNGNVKAVADSMAMTPRSIHMKLRGHSIAPSAYRNTRKQVGRKTQS